GGRGLPRGGRESAKMNRGGHPGAALRMAEPAVLPPDGVLAGWTFDVRLRLLGLAPSWREDDDADGFGIVEQVATLAEPGGGARMTWRFGPNAGTLEIEGEVRGGPALGQIGLPTGFVPLEEIVRVLIEGFGVPPRVEDWRVRLGLDDG
ncbi:MAG: hypothetical protein ACKOWF_20005, partial [Chloroflexota bacterium]